MRIIISPAKKMNRDTDSLEVGGLPRFLPEAQQLYRRLREMSYGELKALWKCNDALARLNWERLQDMDLEKDLTPAILAYEGIQYQYMAPGVFTRGEFAYVQEHLRILSGFYGVLRPFDGVVPYRLEMQARLPVAGARDLYAFWGDRLARQLYSETACVLNLASGEYSRCVARYVPIGGRFITCVFGQRKGEKIVEKGTLCKMARGEMVRYMAENRVTDPEEVKAFQRLGYRYVPEASDAATYTFLQLEPPAGCAGEEEP